MYNLLQIIGKTSSDKAILDGTTPPVNTLVFENTNFKSAPGSRVQRTEKAKGKLEDNNIDSSVISGFSKPISDLLNKSEKQSDNIQMQLAFNKEDGADIKLDFMESDMEAYMPDDKNSTKNLSLPRSMHSITSSNNTITPSTDDALNFKIACVKKVWETSIPAVIEHNVGQDDGNSFATSFSADPNSLDPSVAFTKSGDGTEDNTEGYSSSPNQAATNSGTNVCKVYFSFPKRFSNVLSLFLKLLF